MMKLAVVGALCVTLFVISLAEESIDWLRGGKCKGKWRIENLPGKCPGLNLHSEFKELEHIKEVNSSSACRAICCNLGNKCASWQYELNSGECRLGQVMRFGDESLGVGGWCEPNAPVQWNGRKVVKREGAQVTWSMETLDTQCFGLGPERKQGGLRLNTDQCAEACKNDPNCGMWQEYPGRGCFYGEGGGNCDRRRGAKYEGGRKCIPGYCGGMEEKILGISVDPKDWDKLRQEYQDKIKTLT